MSKQKQTTAVATAAKKPEQQALALAGDRPEWLSGEARGSETVTLEDMLVPRLELVQPLSPCKDEDGPDYIEGAKDGMIFNTVTRELYGKAVWFSPVMFRRQYLLFRSRKAGGGFRGSFPTMAAAEAARREQEDPNNHEVVEAAEHFVLTMHDNQVQPAMLTCTKTKLKVSRQLNSLVRLRGEDSWATAYELGTVKQQNDKGTFYNFSVRPLGFVPEAVYREGEKLWKALESGSRKVRSDFSDMETEQVIDGDM